MGRVLGKCSVLSHCGCGEVGGLVLQIELSLLFFIYIFLNFLFMIVTERERERERGGDIGRGRSRLHAGSPMWDSSSDSRIMS